MPVCDILRADTKISQHNRLGSTSSVHRNPHAHPSSCSHGWTEVGSAGGHSCSSRWYSGLCCVPGCATHDGSWWASQCVKFAVRNYGAALQAAGVLEEVPPLIVGADAVQEKVPEARYLIANANAIGEEVRAYLEKFPNGTAFVPYDQLVDLNEGDVDPGLSQWWWTMPVAYTGASQPGQSPP